MTYNLLLESTVPFLLAVRLHMYIYICILIGNQLSTAQSSLWQKKFVNANYNFVVTWSLGTLYGHTPSSCCDTALCSHV